MSRAESSRIRYVSADDGRSLSVALPGWRSAGKLPDKNCWVSMQEMDGGAPLTFLQSKNAFH